MLLLALGLLTLGCSRTKVDPETRARQFVAALERSVEEGDIGAVKEKIADGYRDNHGNDKRGAVKMLQLRVLQHRNIHAFVRVSKVHIETSGRARCDLLVAVGAQPMPDAETAESIRAAVYKMNMALEPDDDTFVVSSLSWNHAGLDSLFD